MFQSEAKKLLSCLMITTFLLGWRASKVSSYDDYVKGQIMITVPIKQRNWYFRYINGKKFLGFYSNN